MPVSPPHGGADRNRNDLLLEPWVLSRPLTGARIETTRSRTATTRPRRRPLTGARIETARWTVRLEVLSGPLVRCSNARRPQPLNHLVHHSLLGVDQFSVSPPDQFYLSRDNSGPSSAWGRAGALTWMPDDPEGEAAPPIGISRWPTACDAARAGVVLARVGASRRGTGSVLGVTGDGSVRTMMTGEGSGGRDAISGGVGSTTGVASAISAGPGVTT